MMHSQEITADFDTLLRQSSMTSDTYMREAVENIDKMFGKGHAKAYSSPLVVAVSNGLGESTQTVADVLCRQLMDRRVEVGR
jgi:hypothetical protein